MPVQVAGLPVYGVAIPTVSGLRRVLEQLGVARGRRKVLWHNQREEPVVYINGALAATSALPPAVAVAHIGQGPSLLLRASRAGRGLPL